MVSIHHDYVTGSWGDADYWRNLLMAASVFLLFLDPQVVFAAEDFSEVGLNAEVRGMLDVIRGYGLKDPDVLQAMGTVPRHEFVPEKSRRYSYRDSPLGIGYGQTISQPYIVAEMTRQLQLTPASKVLEIGTGSGYQAAVLAELTANVYSVEIIDPLLTRARKTLERNGYQNIRLRQGDGYYGWPEAAPFDGIIVTCAAGHIPQPLLEQLAIGGRMLIPVGKRFGTQYLILVTKDHKGSISSKNLMAVRFVPLVRK